MYQPVWDGVVEGYTKNYIHKNMWRFQHKQLEFMDLLHEAWIVFARCRELYHVEQASHFMQLYKTALHNTFFDIMKGCIGEAEHIVETSEDFDLENAASVEQEGELRVLLSQAPNEIKAVINLLFNAPDELLEMIGFGQRTRRGERILSNKKLCSLLGYNPRKVDLVTSLKRFLSV